jgi:hypothetical protein
MNFVKIKRQSALQILKKLVAAKIRMNASAAKVAKVVVMAYAVDKESIAVKKIQLLGAVQTI